jgi:transposase-like protein
MYLMALKSCRDDQATFLDPILLIGREGATRWHQAVAAIPVEARTRIKAIVADNLPGMRKLAYQQNWVLQLCHFHLLLKLMARRGSIRYALRGGRVREQIHELVRAALTAPDGDRFRNAIQRLEKISRGDCGTLRMQTVLREFLANIPFYRAYREHPSLGLPTTTNAVESMCRLIREMFRSSRAASNPRSAQMWATAFIRLRPTLICNGHSINRKG